LSGERQRCLNLSTRAAHSAKFSADQRNADAQFDYALCLGESRGVSIDLGGESHYDKLSIVPVLYAVVG
jgi:hypothetical protein